MANVGDRYITEIEAVYFSTIEKPLYKMKGSYTLVLDDDGLKQLTPCDEKSDKSEYFQGWDSGTEDGWQLAKKVANLPAAVRDALFGYADVKYIYRMFSAEEAMKILLTYEGE